MFWGLLRLKPPKDKRSVNSTKAKGIGESQVYPGLSGSIGDVIQVTLGVRSIVVYGWRYDPISYGENSEGSFYSAGCRQHVTDHGFVGAYWHGFAVLSQDGLYGPGLR